MKKLLSIILTATLMAGLVGCGTAASENTSSGSEPATSAENSGENAVSADLPHIDGKFIVGLDDEFPPMGFRDDNNEIVGFDIDLAKAAAEKLGCEVEFQPIDWDTKELELESNNIDCIWNGLTMTDERVEAMEFTKPYLKNKQIIIVKNSSPIKSKDDLKGKKIGVQAGSSALDAVEGDDIKDELGEISTYDTNILAFTDLDIERLDAVVADEIVARYYLANNENDFRIIENGDFGDELYGIAAKKGNTEFVNKLQAVLDSMSEDGTAAKISEKWFGEDIYQH
ncbi:MAG: amino acid ABC transporter substrate-binding protein [Firmicutes bacterium]|nr:amino acid ABC transporter substrate-binding protein [Bacillota bacterium]